MFEWTWDEGKRAWTLETRGIDFADMPLVFESSTVTVRSIRSGEVRFQTIGQIEGLTFSVVWVQTGVWQRRMISARLAHRKERTRYDETVKG
jgi:uncharacterized DUF497 family protein